MQYAMAAKRSLHVPAAKPDLSADAPPQWFVSFESRQDKRFGDFEKRLDKRIESLLDEKLGDLSKKVNEHDEKLQSMDFDMKKMHECVKQLQKENGELVSKLDDLENRSRRTNLVMFGIQEADPKEDCEKTIQDFL